MPYDPTNAKATITPEFLRVAWPYLPLNIRIQIALIVWFTIHPLRPVPIRFALLHAALTLVFLSLLPPNPITIPTAYGLALVVLILSNIFHRLSLRMNLI